MDSAGSGNLQSGIVLAVVLSAFFFAERLGGTDQLAKRAFQVGLGVVLALAVIAGTTAFVRMPSAPPSLLENTFDSSDSGSDGGSQNLEAAKDYNRDVANHESARDMIHAGAGVLLLVAGLAALKRWPASSLAVALGGLLLILFGGVSTPAPAGDQSGLGAFFSLYSSLIGGVFGGPSRGVEIAHFAVLAGGAVVLFAFGLMRWDGRVEPPAAVAQEVST